MPQPQRSDPYTPPAPDVPAAPPARSVLQAALADLAEVPATSRWVRSGTVRLHVLDYGGAGPALVVLPGITSPAVTMDFVARELTDLVRPLVVDVRGRGLSDGSGPGEAGEDADGGGTGGYGLERYAEDTEAVIEGLGLDRPLLCGHSMGARIAAVVAARGTVAVRGSVLADPPMSGPGRGPYPTTLETFLRQLAEAGRGTDADEVARSWPRWPRREQELRARWLSSCERRAVIATHRGFETEDFFTWWPRVTGPTALLYGAQSPVVTAAGAARARALLPSAAVTEVPDAGHMLFWDNPPAALDALRAALRPMLA
ncbi:alpha/beta hydrolase [Streptomyces sp. RS10V-4]|uniref:alpha/beta fold hydrolase n=1 Tax=Streptomyces rhizoryzae TaxID=2932493 RepID=UPI0020055922|nr:alpha/beta hydrolase [Streptomyces rhizoryzae]MCK7627811.1 alpha/beta hydrolase [Streptomyces rhizoryzae]